MKNQMEGLSQSIQVYQQLKLIIIMSKVKRAMGSSKKKSLSQKRQHLIGSQHISYQMDSNQEAIILEGHHM